MYVFQSPDVKKSGSLALRPTVTAAVEDAHKRKRLIMLSVWRPDAARLRRYRRALRADRRTRVLGQCAAVAVLSMLAALAVAFRSHADDLAATDAAAARRLSGTDDGGALYLNGTAAHDDDGGVCSHDSASIASHLSFMASGAVSPSMAALWFVLALYVFLGVAAICDEYFGPALEKISDELQVCRSGAATLSNGCVLRAPAVCWICKTSLTSALAQFRTSSRATSRARRSSRRARRRPSSSRRSRTRSPSHPASASARSSAGRSSAERGGGRPTCPTPPLLMSSRRGCADTPRRRASFRARARGAIAASRRRRVSLSPHALHVCTFT
jgi:hypothetical protein